MSSRRGVVCRLPPGHRVAYETTVIIEQSSARVKPKVCYGGSAIGSRVCLLAGNRR